MPPLLLLTPQVQCGFPAPASTGAPPAGLGSIELLGPAVVVSEPAEIVPKAAADAAIRCATHCATIASFLSAALGGAAVLAIPHVEWAAGAVETTHMSDTTKQVRQQLAASFCAAL